MKIESDPNYSMTPIARRPCHRLCAGRVLPLQSRLNRPFISVSSGWQDSAPKHSGINGVPSLPRFRNSLIEPFFSRGAADAAEKLRKWQSLFSAYSAAPRDKSPHQTR